MRRKESVIKKYSVQEFHVEKDLQVADFQDNWDCQESGMTMQKRVYNKTFPAGMKYTSTHPRQGFHDKTKYVSH